MTPRGCGPESMARRTWSSVFTKSMARSFATRQRAVGHPASGAFQGVGDVLGHAAGDSAQCDGRRYPAALAGDLDPEGIVIVPERELDALCRRERVDAVVFACRDMTHEHVLRCATARCKERDVCSGAVDSRSLRPQPTRESEQSVGACATLGVDSLTAVDETYSASALHQQAFDYE